MSPVIEAKMAGEKNFVNHMFDFLAMQLNYVSIRHYQKNLPCVLLELLWRQILEDLRFRVFSGRCHQCLLMHFAYKLTLFPHCCKLSYLIRSFYHSKPPATILTNSFHFITYIFDQALVLHTRRFSRTSPIRPVYTLHPFSSLGLYIHICLPSSSSFT